MSGGKRMAPVVEARLPHRAAVRNRVSVGRKSSFKNWAKRWSGLVTPVDVYCIGHEPDFRRPKRSTVCIHRHPNGGHYKDAPVCRDAAELVRHLRYSAGCAPLCRGCSRLLPTQPMAPHARDGPAPTGAARSAIHCEIRDDAFCGRCRRCYWRLVASVLLSVRAVAQEITRQFGSRLSCPSDSTRSVSVGAVNASVPAFSTWAGWRHKNLLRCFIDAVRLGGCR